jgi:hypothetical protein
MSFDDFISDDKTIDAVVRNFEIIGEAANRVPDNFKSDHPEIEWRRMTGYEIVLSMNTLELIMLQCGKSKKKIYLNWLILFSRQLMS